MSVCILKKHEREGGDVDVTVTEYYHKIQNNATGGSKVPSPSSSVRFAPKMVPNNQRLILNDFHDFFIFLFSLLLNFSKFQKSVFFVPRGKVELN
jgi:hypothetical protein